jgi:hypothetical protein
LNREDSRGLGTEVEKVSEPGNQVPFFWIYNFEEILTRHFSFMCDQLILEIPLIEYLTTIRYLIIETIEYPTNLLNYSGTIP